jgi:hypothetical protein
MDILNCIKIAGTGRNFINREFEFRRMAKDINNNQ